MCPCYSSSVLSQGEGVDQGADRTPLLGANLNRDKKDQVTDSQLVCSSVPLQHPSHTIHVSGVVITGQYCVHLWFLGILPLLPGLLCVLFYIWTLLLPFYIRLFTIVSYLPNCSWHSVMSFLFVLFEHAVLHVFWQILTLQL